MREIVVISFTMSNSGIDCPAMIAMRGMDGGDMKEIISSC
jgi:hypothetical protein